MGGKAGQQQNSTSTTVLPANQQQNVDMIMQGARDQFQTGGPQFFPGQTYAGATDPQLQARQGAMNYATGVGGEFANSVRTNDQYWMNPNNVFNPSNIPGFQRAQEGVTTNVTNNLMRNILPSLREGDIASGSLGGSRGEISEGLAIGESNRALGDTLAGMNMNAYGMGLQQQNAAAARAPQTYSLGLAPQETLGIVGGQQRADQQQAIDANVQRFNFEQMRPLLNLQALQSLTGTAGQYGGTTQSSQTGGTSGGNTLPLQGLGTLMTFMSMFGGN